MSFKDFIKESIIDILDVDMRRYGIFDDEWWTNNEFKTKKSSCGYDIR